MILYKRYIRKFILLASGLLILSCASVQYQEDITDYQAEIQKLQKRLATDSTDTEALRDLGVIYFQTRNYQQAKSFLRDAYLQDISDPKTIFYRGLNLEFEQREEEAIQLYKGYTQVSRFSPYRKLMAGRYRWLNREFARKEARLLLQDTLRTPRIQPKTVAVFPMIYRGGDDKYSPLGRGLSEMIMVDLGHVPGISLVERIQMQALLNELAFAKSKYVNPESSPKHGQLLGASKIVGGIYDVLNKDQMFVDMSYWDLYRNEFPYVAGKTDRVDQLFRLEKTLVFEIIRQLEIELTPEEKERIEFIPTKNLNAFMAFCMGLEKEDAYLYDQAVQYYQQAIYHDPSFGLAHTGAERAESLDAGGGTAESISLSVPKPAQLQTNAGGTMMNNRMQKMSSSMGSNFIPGEESRKPMEEVVNTAGALDVLPEPPPPPENQ